MNNRIVLSEKEEKLIIKRRARQDKIDLLWTNVRTLYIAFMMKGLGRCPLCYHKLTQVKFQWSDKPIDYCKKCWGGF